VFALDTNALIHALKGMGQLKQKVEQTRPSDLKEFSKVPGLRVEDWF
jgi:hypothetical protein